MSDHNPDCDLHDPNIEGIQKPCNCGAGSSLPSAAGYVRDWPEDFSHENGNYFNRCFMCQSMFVGHKRRFICKLCAQLCVQELRRMEARNEQGQR